MSVIFFAPDELAAIAEFAVGNTSSRDGQERLARYIDALAQYSTENAAAYECTYSERTIGWTVEQIKNSRQFIRDTKQIKRIIDTLGLLRYNLVSNQGADFASKETLSAILSMTLAIMRKSLSAPLMAA